VRAGDAEESTAAEPERLILVQNFFEDLKAGVRPKSGLF